MTDSPLLRTADECAHEWAAIGEPQDRNRICLKCGEPSKLHDSDCAVNNAPALPVAACDCGAEPHVHVWKFYNINNIDYCKCGVQRSHQEGTR